MSQCERCHWALYLDGRLFCQNNALPVKDAGQDERACEGYRAGAPTVEWRTQKAKGSWKRLGA